MCNSALFLAVLFLEGYAIDIKRPPNIPHIIIDGDIESTWSHVDSITTFIQWEPHEGKVPTESTKVYICYDDENSYIDFKCYNSEPTEIDIKRVPRDYISKNLSFREQSRGAYRNRC